MSSDQYDVGNEHDPVWSPLPRRSDARCIIMDGGDGTKQDGEARDTAGGL